MQLIISRTNVGIADSKIAAKRESLSVLTFERSLSDIDAVLDKDTASDHLPKNPFFCLYIFVKLKPYFWFRDFLIQA